MKLIAINRNPSARQLRQFAALCIVALPLLVWLWGGSSQGIRIAGVTGLLSGIAGLVRPSLIKPIFLLLMYLTAPIGIVMGELILMLIYFVVFLPIALLFRISGRDALRLRGDPKAKSWWIVRGQPRSAAGYYRQFTTYE